MIKNFHLNSLVYCIQKLYCKKIIAYPTESMFGLGCDPDSKIAVDKLLNLKKRNIKKGFILVAAYYNQIKKYIDETKISVNQKKNMFHYWPGHFTFLVPSSSLTPYWLTGKSNNIAVRISNHLSIVKLCNTFGKPLISTSANFSNMPPCLTRESVLKNFGKDFPLFNGNIGDEKNPSKIINIMNGNLIRYA
ncbi:L-threonylcarbamoyladenylate synthase type 1 TsaC [Buchnera aphidicola (Aphis craccivora)]|uniref:Threonylcarbamoyl-AMP synthase n=1 Tax=Buchnera aphidicola (Aphis craccivora) TaxID=466616 RepID=A0A4D6XV30_9GAMM|nr:Sua5/YciO/YrdC/YwlC family protein [Buchnera aphidicola]QCI16715.1 L-threonylcarbamoyladenylate synthase type 1 TsaC [Buchnera aphidicola (Aphis craccivora)]QLL40848.1 L-threonylcarbamoyladenylate synthase type 1 TsaC [Buchnera aphidicola (Aphis craccivore)]WAI17690.1 MAG: Sua5/YciO/YrdC/YwlC family protein [Buchnera aphidicola (Aphis craccivora)]